MAKNRRNQKEKPRIFIEPRTKRLVGAVITSACGLVLILAYFQLAGPAGKFIWQTFSFLMGWGYLLLPLAFFAMAIALIRGVPQSSWTLTLGIVLLVLAILGIADELEPGKAGLIGQAVSSISSLFGFWASIVIMAAAGISGLFMAFHGAPHIQKDERPEKKTAIAPPVQVAIEPVELPKQPRDTAKESGNRQRPKETERNDEELALSAKTFLKEWDLPPLDLLEEDSSSPTAGDVRINSNIIKRTLENFGIPVEMAEVHIGPTVTQYTLKPAQGVKLAKIVALQNDLALALAAHPIRIEAPIPGKALVGIEVPNKAAAVVRMRTLFKDAKFFEERSPLAFLLGRDVMGVPVSADLTRMPHLLIAGATGSGKSIFIHSLLISFLFRNPPHLLRLILIDPKRVELSQYQGIPHLLTPVITEGKKAVNVLRWVIKEMDRRYAMLLGASSRDITSYNASRSNRPEEIMPFIVIIIDELADLMAAFGREVEGAIVRLAQMARATGIHLVVSTQRPSVEVITGLIKANITSRVAFQVASQVDSRTILDMAGAEKLLGFGDMLFLAPDTSKPRRIQAPYVSEREIKRVVEFLVKQGEEFESSFRSGLSEAALGQALNDESPAVPAVDDEIDELGEDPLYNEAVKTVRLAKKASASLLQRRLKIGYARAARLLDIMEARGIIGPADGAKPREVYGLPQERKDE
jgi:S-DNA-T family DNA segregation ATPase FtsK/SpoIIIE